MATARPTPTRRPASASRPPSQIRSGTHGRAVTTATHVDSRSKTEYSNEQTDEVVATTSFPPGEEPAQVRFGAGLTINLQNFESLRLDCHVTLPCRVEELDAAMDSAAEFVARKLDEQEQLWTGKTRV
jgi:hypothetical protein